MDLGDEFSEHSDDYSGGKRELSDIDGGSLGDVLKKRKAEFEKRYFDELEEEEEEEEEDGDFEDLDELEQIHPIDLTQVSPSLHVYPNDMEMSIDFSQSGAVSEERSLNVSGSNSDDSSNTSGSNSDNQSQAVDIDDESEDDDDDYFGAHEHEFGSSKEFLFWLREQRVQDADPRNVLLKLVEQFDLSRIHPSFLWDTCINLGLEIAKTFIAPRRKLSYINDVGDVVELLSTCQNILVVTGAGVSASAGIPDFRSENGIYSMVKDTYDLPTPESLFNFNYFCSNPVPFFQFAHKLWPRNHKPTTSHHFIAMLEKQGRLLRNYTQNIDDLEGQAHIERKLQCHGSFASATCMSCKKTVDNSIIDEDVQAQRIPYCKECVDEEKLSEYRSTGFPQDMHGILKPDITFFGEALPESFFTHIQDDLAKTDLCLVMGSSMQVNPVASILEQLPPHVPLVLINREPVGFPHEFDVELLGDCDVIVKHLLHSLDPSQGESFPYEGVTQRFHFSKEPRALSSDRSVDQ